VPPIAITEPAAARAAKRKAPGAIGSARGVYDDHDIAALLPVELPSEDVDLTTSLYGTRPILSSQASSAQSSKAGSSNLQRVPPAPIAAAAGYAPSSAPVRNSSLGAAAASAGAVEQPPKKRGRLTEEEKAERARAKAEEKEQKAEAKRMAKVQREVTRRSPCHVLTRELNSRFKLSLLRDIVAV